MKPLELQQPWELASSNTLAAAEMPAEDDADSDEFSV